MKLESLQLARLVDEAPEGDEWFHEQKFDGYRILANLDHGDVELLSRRFNDWTAQFPTVVEAVSHAPATLFNVRERGFLREGYHADLVLVDPEKPHLVTKADVLSKCGWSPFEGYTFRSSIAATFVNGHLAWHEGELDDHTRGRRLEFAR